nr:MAG: hypothetical protein AM324_01015 [Candidatus Thorarchaeota archaeon SMTZ1-83]
MKQIPASASMSKEVGTTQEEEGWQKARLGQPPSTIVRSLYRADAVLPFGLLDNLLYCFYILRL